ncbi:MOB member 4, phocein [Mortierella sp. AM989]|nr:MOB member 4, phocein [Mortierella sp. AM989]
MLMETQEHQSFKQGKANASSGDSAMTYNSSVESKSAASTAAATAKSWNNPLRNLPGTKDEKLYQWPQRPLESIESAFALREYLQALIRQDPHNVDFLITLPAGQDENAWLYEHLCQICLELNYLIVHLEPECTPEVCPEMRAEEWKYFCATHPTPSEAETSLYERFLKLSKTRQLITAKLIIIPSQDNVEDATHLGPRQIMARSRDE